MVGAHCAGPHAALLAWAAHERDATPSILQKMQAQASMEAGGRDVYDKRAVQPPNATGGIQLGPASAASAAVERAGRAGGAAHDPLRAVPGAASAVRAVLHRCYQLQHLRHMVQDDGCGWRLGTTLCVLLIQYPVPGMGACEQANFVGDAQYKQHLDSAIHRKALAKEEARKQP